MPARSMRSLALGLLLLAMLGSVASAKPRVAILGLEVIGSLDPDQSKLAKQLTNGLRDRAGAATGPLELAPNSDKELVDEKLMNNCGTEAIACMTPIGVGMQAEYLMYGKIEKVEKGYHVTIKLLRVSTKMPGPTFSEIISVSEMKNDVKGVAKRAYAMLTAPEEGTVTIRLAKVERATVYIDDKPVGSTTSGVLTFRVTEGKHRLAVVPNERGWKSYEEEITISAGEQRTIPVELPRMDQGPKPVQPKDPPLPPPDNGTSSEPSHDTTRVVSGGGGGGGGWTGLAIGGSILTLASIGGFAWGWYELSQIGQADNDSSTRFWRYSCSDDDPETCSRGKRAYTVSIGTGIGAGVLGVFTVYAFYKSTSRKERPVAGGRSTKARRELTVTPIVSAQGGGATLRFDW